MLVIKRGKRRMIGKWEINSLEKKLIGRVAVGENVRLTKSDGAKKRMQYSAVRQSQFCLVAANQVCQ